MTKPEPRPPQASAASAAVESTLEAARKTLIAASVSLRCAELNSLSCDVARQVADLCDETLLQIGKARKQETQRRGGVYLISNEVRDPDTPE